MTRSEQKDLERLGIAVAAGMVLHIVVGLAFMTVEWSPRREVYPKTILVDLSDPVPAPLEDTSKPEAPNPEPAEPVRETEAPPSPQPEPSARTQTAVEQPAPAKAAPAQAAAKPAPARPQQQPVSRPQPVQSTPKTADAKPTPTSSVSSAPVEGPPTRLAVDPSQEIPAQRQPTDLGTRRVAETPSLQKPKVEVPDWVHEDGASAPSPATARSSGNNTPARTGTEPRDAIPGLDFDRLDRAIAQAGSVSAQPQSGSPEPQVLAPPAPAPGAGARTSLRWNDPEEGREVTLQVKPVLPDWVEKDGLRFEVRVSLAVLPGGTVSMVTFDKNSGYTDVDKAIEDAVRRWRFSPASSGGTAYGMLTLYIQPDVR